MYWPTALLTVLAAGTVSAITQEQVADARGVCRGLIKDDNRRIGGFVRMAFHDCVGGCNGCISPNLPDNAGLRTYANALETGYTGDVASSMSRADFWILCADEALNVGRESANGAPPLQTDMKFGREDDCTGRFNSNIDDATNFPNPRWGIDNVTNWCNEQFQLSQRECVALLGAHTLGRTRATASGYIGPWTRGNGSNTLDNRYYQEMNNVEIWTQEDVAVDPPNPEAERWQYRDDNRPPRRNGNIPPPRIMMLNSDVCFVKNITLENHITGEATSESLSLMDDSATRPIVAEYAGDNNLWIQEFTAVFKKMVETIKNGAILESPTA